MNEKRDRKTYTKSFKADAVNLILEQGYSCAEVARRLGVNPSNVNRWLRQYRDNKEKGPGGASCQRDREAEIRQLRKENKRLQMEREILKKAAAFFAKESS